VIHKNRTPYLRAYAPPKTDIYEGRPIQSPGAKEIFLVLNGTRHAFPDFSTFVKMKFDLDDVLSVPHGTLAQIPKGSTLRPIT
jgi:hypothetical protein